MNITYDAKSFFMNGKREWLFLGEIHYFRFPKEEWRKVIRMAKAAGINAITTYLAWNYHENREGVFDFSGDRNFAEFIDIAKDEGMYVFLRPGPYICAEWCGGGIPPWILNYENLEIRVDEETFMRCSENWYKAAMKFVVPRLITNGGNIIAVQNDNEYPGGWDEKGASYIKKIYNLLRKYGIDVPITACNAHCVGGKLSVNYDAKGNWKQIYEDIIVTYNTAGEASVIPELKAFQPQKPTVITELWTGPQLYWGETVSNSMVQKANVCRFCAMQSQVNLYMFAGGNNYAYYAGNNIATSYASSYPIGEGNTPKEQYYDSKIMGMFMKTFGEFIAECDYTQIKPKEVYCQKGKEGEIVYVIPGKPNCKYSFNDKEYYVTTGQRGYAMLLHDFQFHNSVINETQLSVYGRIDNMMFFVGNAGEEKKIIVNGNEYNVFVKYHDVDVIDADDIKLVIADEFMAKRTWIVKDGVFIGYDMAYDTEEGVYKELCSDRNIVVIKDGQMLKKWVEKDIKNIQMPVLENWEITDAIDTLSFKSLEKPAAHNKLNINHGYVWYKAKANSDHAGYFQMMIPAFSNRIFVYVNKRFYGIFGDKRNSRTRWDYQNPTDAVREAIPVYMEKGENEVLFLSEDTGYAFDDIKPMGIMSEVYFDVSLSEIKNAKFMGKTPITDSAFDYMYSKTVKDMKMLNTLTFEVELGEDEDVFFVVHAKPCYIYINGEDAKPVKPIKHPWQSFAHTSIWATYLSNNIKAKNTVKIQYYCSTDEILSATQMYIAKKGSKLFDWEYSRFAEKVEVNGVCDFKNIAQNDSTLLVPGGEVSSVARGFMPKYFVCKFNMPESEKVFLEMGNMKKGQIFLNGINVGKFNTKLTQKYYYLPKAYMKDENELVIFEEYGTLPLGVSLKDDFRNF